MGFAEWVDDFETAARQRRAIGEPNWDAGARLPAAIVRSVQRFQVGEDGDGANLIGKSDGAGDAGYATAVRMFVAEEQRPGRGEQQGEQPGVVLEERHVPFHCQRLRAAFDHMSPPVRTVACGLWWFLLTGAAVAVAVDHGSALRGLGVGRREFVRDVLRLFRSAVDNVSRRPALVS